MPLALWTLAVLTIFSSSSLISLIWHIAGLILALIVGIMIGRHPEPSPDETLRKFNEVR